MKAARDLTIKEVAQKAGVSVATVSRVINNNPRVKPETRERVIDVIRESDYTPNAVARSLSVQTTGNIAVMIPDLKNPFFALAVSGVTSAAEENRFNVFLFDTQESIQREETFLLSLRGLRLEGLIIVPIDSFSEKERDLLNHLNHSVPVVAMDRDVEGGMFSKVLADNESGAYQAVTRLIQEGHRKIALVEGKLSASPMVQRRSGYLRALQDNGITFHPQYVAKGGMSSPGETYGALVRLFGLPDPPTAILTCNPIMTLGSLRYFSDHRMVCGRDVAIIACDDIKELQMVGYEISVVQSFAQEIGQTAVRLLAEHRETGRIQSVVVPTRLVLRGTEKYKF